MTIIRDSATPRRRTTTTRRRALTGLLATGALVVSITAATSASGASAPVPTTPTHPCFMVQPHWTVGLDGPQPVCGGTRIDESAASRIDESAASRIDPAVSVTPPPLRLSPQAR